MSSPPDVLFTRLLARARLRHLQLLVAVADHGTLKRAAEQVGMSQPAATQAIGELERLLEVALFDRQPRGMRVSAAGQVVMPVVRQALHALELSLEALSAVRSGASGLLRIGVIPAATVSLLIESLPALGQRHSRLQIQVIEGTPSQLLKELASGSLNVVLTRPPAQLGARFCFEPLVTDQAVVVAGLRHPLASRTQVSLDELAGYPWMQAPAGVKVRELFDELFATRAQPIVHPLSTSSPTMIVALLEDNRTVTLAPNSVADWYVRRGLAARLAVDMAFPLAGLGAAYPAASRDEPATAALLEVLRSTAGERVVRRRR